MESKKTSVIVDHQSGELESRLIWEGLLVGVFSGSIAIVYRLALSYMDDLRQLVLHNQTTFTAFLAIPILILLAYIVVVLLKWAPFSSGSGIPQIHAELLGRIEAETLPTIVSKFIGGSINNFVGLSLGREGPSIQLGGTVAKLIGQLFKRNKLELHYLISAGSAAGLAAAFNAPLAGVLFVLEELYSSLSKYIMIPTIIASLTANFLSFRLLGMEPAFSFRVVRNLPIEELHWVILLGILAGLIGCSFNLLLEVTRKFYSKLNVSPFVIFSILFILVFIVGQKFDYILGGGHHLVEEIVAEEFSLVLLGILLVTKLTFTAISFSSGAQGGIFLPVLVLGATTGALFFNSLNSLINIGDFETNFIILGMAAVLAAVVRAPLMSIVLVTEMTGSFNHLLSISTVVLIALFVSDYLKVQPIYHTLYNHLVANHEEVLDQRQTVISNFTLPPASHIAGEKIENLHFPTQLLIISIVREGNEFVPNGNDMLQVADQLIVVHNAEMSEKVSSYFQKENII